MTVLQCSLRGQNKIKILEGKKYKRYPDSEDFPTIGFGHLIKLPAETYLLSATLTDEQMQNLFIKDLTPIENWLNRIVCDWKEPATQYEFDALCSFIFNETKVMYLPNTFPNMLSALHSGDRQNIAHMMEQFCNAKAGSGDGLLKARRLKEVTLFLYGKY